MSATITPAADIASQILGLIGQQDPMGRGDDEEVGKALRACARDQLLVFSRQLGLTGVTKLAKDVLAGRIAAALLAARAAMTPVERETTTETTETGNAEASAAKFDLGPDVFESRPPQTIPWGYGSDRVTAMAVDPNRLYVYWEVTDAAIAAARKQLGLKDTGGADAWLDLRVYDITGRLFDGTNAHSYFDEGIGRDVRQWFFEIGKPTSTACVEVGLKSNEGFFVRIARSGRVDFPREEPLPVTGAVEWLTVRTATGYAGPPMAGGAPHPDGYVGPGTLGGASSEDWQDWSDGAGFPNPEHSRAAVTRSVDGGVEWRETGETYVHHELGRVEWVGPVERSEWQAGPFATPVDVPSMVEHHASGEVSMRTEDGVVHLVYGPWQVVIRGTGARAERRVLATWEYRRTIELPGGVERDDGVVGQWEPVGPGASEWRLVGASERRWLGASELLFRGGSEVWLVGASERFFKGASERLYRGASERLYRGASERLKRGASERRLGGASERMIEGGYPGASERNVHGAGRLGASENSGARSTRSTDEGDDVLPYPRPER